MNILYNSHPLGLAGAGLRPVPCLKKAIKCRLFIMRIRNEYYAIQSRNSGEMNTTR